ncbi:hypothetical protein OG196_31820 [Kitasatospora purpeofusca]|uniref:hypothetical protein n=1 Tax=Kitasatospora purpeofusca TaxID=67352 RepID=UPI002E157984|nr:hypothetical protein OG196_31820 [Kitasatospora purpeofusca]
MDEATDWLLRRRRATGRKPAAVLLNELRPGQGDHVAERLGMRHFPAPIDLSLDEKDSRRQHLNAIFIDPDGPLVPDPNWEANWLGPWLPPATVQVWIRNPDGSMSRRQIFLGCEHACYWHPGHRETTARFFTVPGKDLRLGHVEGDFNGWTEDRAPLTLDNVPDRAFAQNRSVLVDGVMVPDTQADTLMTGGGFVYVHGYAADTLGIEAADAPTIVGGPDKERQRIPVADQPPAGLSAIDRTYATKELIPAVVDANVIKLPDLADISDHWPRYTHYGYQKLVEITNRPVTVVRH